jgi:hypothetical protein
MAREGGGGGGAFGWTLLGILVGVAGTLAVETLLSNHQAREASEEQPASSAAVVAVAAPVAAKPVIKAPAVAVSSQKSVTATPAQEDVEDDAAAAGMTSRSRPSDQSAAAPN